MAVKFTHLLVGLGVACAVVAAVYLPPQGTPFGNAFDFHYVPLQELHTQVSQEFEALALLERRDHALPRLEEEPNGTWLYVDPALPANLDSAIRVAAAGEAPFEWLESAPRLAAGVFLDTVRWRDGFFLNVTRQAPRLRYIIDTARADGRTCLTVTTIGADIRDAWLDPDPIRPPGVPYSSQSLFGPCHLIGAFGSPSPQVAEWIMSGAFEPSESLQARCLKDEVVACRLMLFRGESSAELIGIAGRIGILGGARGSIPRFNAYDQAFFRHVIDSVGAERFTEFWTGTGSVDSSFHRHIGKPIELVLKEWFESRRGDVDRETTVVEPAVVFKVFAAVLVCVLVSGGIVANRRATTG